ncbi:hypothetical protein SARC_00216 [Sphaeroforma arctica JP610]|uniref:Post-GPI attachment to proteins factor 3 n=1 Tax=Sphaeroforma arctica JP610 TaxID=667725 RepID=A0A0L0GF87_9EUKA|nr:hypothetical protein SARC_00216 [Sphaeroforma arctica JP610]KNC87710.1 hypothetical protein SARC_00216 [Sphaeroforma arctica JP610]|eukprot:XP_014161612.1 hypothetical protein SARC_00216 [Sphaeroforma arctica JP610]
MMLLLGWRLRPVLVVFIGLPLLKPCLVVASVGDTSYDFQYCLHNCVEEWSGTKYPQNQIDLHLRWLGWTPEEDCQYTCMHAVTEKDVQRGRKIRQFYGKWPFIRIAGVQEPASVFASILNAWAHLTGLQQFTTNTPERYRLRELWMAWSLFSVNAWVWSSIFHCRDTPFTEKMDYFSATAVILVQTYAAARHTNWIRRKNWIFPLALTCFFVYHICYLTFRHRFDYSYNMVAMVTLSVVHSLWWLIWCVLSYRDKPHVRLCVAAIALAGVFMAFEVFDFAPLWGHIDAHCLWHFGTVPVAILWYRFLILDAQQTVDVEHGD